jgi:steroid 5-alpha reductase family enzyme
LLELFALSAAGIAALMLGTWVLSLLLRNASIVDIIWGLGFVLVAVIGFAFGDGYGPRKALITGMTAAWGLRLSIYLFLRNAGAGEDFRYKRMRAHYGPRFGLISLFTVFALQGALMFVVSLPVQVAQAAGPDHLTWLDGAGALVWLAGLLFESIGDWQLARFKADAANAGKVMDRGLWAWTRHPNYFGDSLVWWGIFVVAASEPTHLWAIVGPIVMTTLLVRVSGVALLEKTIVRRRPGYEEYIARTSSFIPRPPRRTPGETAATPRH